MGRTNKGKDGKEMRHRHTRKAQEGRFAERRGNYHMENKVTDMRRSGRRGSSNKQATATQSKNKKTNTSAYSSSMCQHSSN